MTISNNWRQHNTSLTHNNNTHSNDQTKIFGLIFTPREIFDMEECAWISWSGGAVWWTGCSTWWDYDQCVDVRCNMGVTVDTNGGNYANHCSLSHTCSSSSENEDSQLLLRFKSVLLQLGLWFMSTVSAATRNDLGWTGTMQIKETFLSIFQWNVWVLLVIRNNHPPTVSCGPWKSMKNVLVVGSYIPPHDFAIFTWDFLVIITHYQ